MAQINPTVGDLYGNSRKIVDYIDRAKDLGIDVVSFPELAVTGYPPEDLLLKPSFIRENGESLKKIARAARGITAVVGFVDKSEGIYNAAAVLHNGSIAGVYRKIHLPNYGVFDEERYFRKGTGPFVFFLDSIGIGITICEDIWHPEGPVVDECCAGAEVILNINASPYHMGKWRERLELIPRMSTYSRDPSTPSGHFRFEQQREPRL
jgi:NAD+ synthase (glutamine-hydrolysing)